MKSSSDGGNGINGWKNFIIGVASAIILLLLGVVGFGVKMAWDDMKDTHTRIEQEIAKLKRCQ